MGREIKRVPLDFDWPMDKVWKGYHWPERLQGTPCPDCDGGQTHFGWWLQKLSYLIGMLAEDVRTQEAGGPIHPYFTELPNGPHGHLEWNIDGEWQKYPALSGEELRRHPCREVVDRPSRDALTMFASLLSRPEEEIGHSFGDHELHYVIMRKLEELSGVSTLCSTCQGHGNLESYPGMWKDSENYSMYSPENEPPEGPGWQLWETVSEGSPISPVFPEAEGLIEWMTSPAYTWGASNPLTRKQAESFVKGHGWAPSLVFSPATGLIQGDAYMGDRNG